MTTSLGWLLIVLAGYFTESVIGGETCKDPDRLIVCHIESELHPSTDPCSCTHLVIHKPHDAEIIKAAGKLREKNRRLKILSLSQEGKKNLLEDGVSGVYLKLSKSLSKDLVIKNVKALATELDNLQASKRANAKYSSENPDSSSKDVAEIILELPSSPEQLAKNYDLKSLNKYVNYFIISSDNLTDVSEDGLAYHPSRLMGIDDILNTDSLVDLISGLGAEHEKLLVSLPATALKFNLKDPKDNMPRAKVTGPPKSISQKELCSLIENGVWTLERDEDLTAPYAFSDTTWLAFDDSVSASIKAKYILLRGLAGIAVTKSEADDWDHVCASRPILDTIYSTFTNLVRKPRAATLLSLQDQIHNSISPFAGDIQLSPYRIVRVVDRAGSVHVVRKEAKTEFQCSRQGYFTHPSGCNRFYRCVKFNQYSSDFTVFEYDCPAGLAFDERYEVCVWPGSLPDASACKGSSEIAPVPRSRYACSAQGYFADPENCRWFFACLDHHGDGRAPTAYEFRCPFGLVFNEKTLTCDWPWSVPGCGGGSGSVIHTSSIYPGDILEGRLRPAYAQVSDLHVSGGRIADVDGGLVLGTNLLSGISTSGQRYSSGYGYGLASQINSGFGNTKYEDNSGAYIHDPTGDAGGEYIHEEGPQGPQGPHGTGSLYSAGHESYGISSSIANGNSGRYVHDSRGDNAGQYDHSEGSLGTGSYISSGVSGGYHAGGKVLVSGGSELDNSGAYVHDSRGDNAGQYVHSEGSLGTGSYITSGVSGGYQAGGKVLVSGSSVLDNSGAYVHDSRGDSGGQYVHSEGLQGTGSHSLSGASGGYYGGGKVLVSGGSGLDNSGAYVHDSRGDNAGQHVHSEGSLGTGSYISSGVSGGYHAGGKVLVSGGSVVDNSGAYVHDSRGDNAGQYVHSEGSQGTGLYSTSGLSSGYYAGGKVLVSGGSGVDNSGAYIHDSRGDGGGAYVHQDGPEGPGSKPYLHSGSSSIKYGNADGQLNAYEHGETGYVHQIGTSSPSSVIYSGIKTSGSDYSGASGAQLTTDLHQSEIHRQQASFGPKTPNTLLSGSYIHDSRGDAGGAYVHQEGSSGTGSISYAQQEGSFKDHNIVSGIVKTNQVYSTDYLGNGGFSSGSYGGSSGQYIHDSTGDKGGEYIHQEGPSGPGPVPYVHQEGTNVESGLRDGLKTYKTNYVGQNIVGLGGFTSGSLNNIYNSGQYIHDSRGDTGGDYVHHDGPSYYQGLYAGRYIGNYIHDNSGSYVHDSSGYYNQPYVHQAGPSRPSVPLYQGVDIYNSQYAGQYASKYATDQKHLINYGSTNIGGATHLYQPGGVIHTYDTSRLHVQPLGYKESVLRPVNIAKFSGVPLNPVQYSSHVLPISVTTPRPAILTEIQSHKIQPITVTEKPIVPLNPVQYITPLKGIKGSQEISHSYVSPTTYTKPISVNPVQYHQETTVNTGFSGYDYSKPKITFSYPEHIIKHQYAVQPTPATYLTGYSYHPSVSVQPVKTVISQPVLKTNIVSTVFGTSTPRPDVISFKEPSIVSHIVKPVSVTSSHIVPLNPVQYGTKVETIQVSTPAPTPLIYNQQYNPVIRTQTVRPIIVSSTPAVPLSPVQYGTKVQTFVSSTPAPLQVPIHSYNPVIKTQTLHPVIVSSTPAVPLNPVQYGIKTISSSAGYHYSKPIVGLSYPKGVYSTQAPPVINYTYQKPLVKTQPIQPIVSTPALPDVSVSHEIPLHQISISNPPSSFGYSYQQPIKPIVPVSVSTPAPPVVSYSYQQPIKHVPIAVSTPATPVVSYSSTPRPITVSSTPVVPLNPVQYVNPIRTAVQPAFGYSYQQPLKPLVPVSVSKPSPPVVSYSYQQPIKPAINIAVSTPAPPVVSYSYRQPVKPVAISTPAPAVISYSTTPRPIVVSSTPSVPLNPVQYVNPISTPVQPAFRYSYKRPVNPVVPVSVSTPAPPVVSYSYQQPIKHVPIAVSTPAPQVVSYSTTLRPIQPIRVSSTPAVPLNPVQYVNPISTIVQPAFGYSYKRPLKPAPPVVSYSYQQPIKSVDPIRVSTPAPPVVSYSTTLKPIQPILVSSTPTVPLNPVQYFNHISPSTPAPSPLGYSYKQSAKPISFNVPISTSAPSLVSYSYKQQVPVYKPAPAVEFSYQQSVKPEVHYQTPLKPIAPIHTYSYQNPTTPAPPVIVSTPAPFISQSHPIQHIKQVNPINVYSYKQTLAPVSVDSPARPSFTYSQPAPFSTSAPAILNYSYNAKGVVVSSTPTVPLNPVQYVKQVTTPIPSISYTYKRPLEQSVVNKGTNTIFSYTFDSKPVQPITVSSTPAIPLNPVQYSVTPAPAVTLRPVSTYSTPSVPVINYSYQPSIKPITNRPLRPAVVTTHAPEVSYSYSEPDYFLKLKTVRPVSVTSTPVVPLNPVQYVSTTPRPIINYQYQNPIIKTHTSVVAPSIDYYNEEELHRELTKIKPKPAVGSFYEVPTQTTTLAPITVTSTPVIPLNPVQYVKHPQPVFSYTYNSAQSASYNTKGCCSSSSIKVSSTPKPVVLKTTAYPSTIISTKKPVVGAYFEENYEANRQEEGYVYSRPNIKFEETPLVKGIYSTSPPYNNLPKVTSTYLQRPVQTYANTVEEESYISNTPEHVTTLVKQPISVDTNDEDLNLHLDIPKIGVSGPVYTTTNTPQQQIVEVTTVTPVVKRVKVKGGLTRGGYYVRRQKVKVQPVITTTENYPAYFTSTIKPIYSSTIDLSSPTLYSSTVRPSTVYTTSSTTLKDDELELEDEDYDSKLLEQVSGQFGEIINAGNQGIIRQGVSSTTVSSLKDGETIVGVVKKQRVAGGRNKAKVVVVSKLSDFNPLLVGKLGAECSCKSNSKTLNLQRGSSGSRGQLFYPEVQNARVPSREYLPTSSEAPKVDDYYLPTSEVPFISAKASTTEEPNSYDDQSYVEIRPINKVQKFYTSTGPTLDTINVEYDATTKRSISTNKVGINQGKTLEKGASFDRYGPGGLRGSDETLQGSVDCQRAGLFRHPKYCNKFYACNWDEWKKRFTLHVFNCPIHLAYDSQLGACNWPSKGPACADDNLLV